jgi:reverse gyrase
MVRLLIMAYIQQRECRECGETKSVNVHSFNGMCPECRAKAASEKKRKTLAGLKGLTVEERLNRVEEILYDLDAESRLKALEALNQRYA